MLYACSSNRLETLLERLAAVVSAPVDNPFHQETIVVQSRGMQRWLSMRLAEQLGVWANAEFPFPNTMAARIFAACEETVPERSPWDPEPLAWQLFGALPALLPKPGFEDLRRYLDEEVEDDFKRFQLVQRIARLFDQYLLFRPDLIADWEAGKETHEQAGMWQAALWRETAAVLGPGHRAALRSRVLERLDRGRPEGLPPRITVFGISALPPFHLELFMRAAKHIDVHLFLMNPSALEWGSIEDEGSVLRKEETAREQGQVPEDLHWDRGNPLLASMGKLGRDFFDLVQELGSGSFAREEDHFFEPPTDRVLGRIQAEILTLAPGEPLRPEALDDSLQIHACHSPMREVEVLRDRLLALLEADETLEPRDIVVMAPDIRGYTPAVEAVFGAAGQAGRHAIPFSVADRSARETNAVAEILFALLDLVDSRFPATRVLRLLDFPAVRSRLDLGDGDLDRISSWLMQTRVRWGRDGKHKEELGLPPYPHNTWRFVLDRMLLGYALPAGGERLFEGILPFDDIEGGDARLLGALCAFYENLVQAARNLQRARSPQAWAEALEQQLVRLVQQDDSNSRDWEQVRRMLTRLSTHADTAAFEGTVSRKIAVSLLQAYFEGERGVSPYLGGGITFCSLLPMRSIPFKVVCLLGMNERDYPRRDPPLGFDLIARHPRRGDRSRRNDDRYLFLEALLSAREVLYISYAGRNQRDNEQLPPSVLVNELIDYLSPRDKEGADALRAQLVHEHPLQPFSPQYFAGVKDWFSYSESWCAAAGVDQQEPDPLFAEPLPPAPPVEELELETLVRFFENPTRWFLENRLGIYLPQEPELLEDRVSETLDPLDKYQLKTEFLDYQVLETDPDHALELVTAQGELPHGIMGELLGRELQAEAIKFSRHIKDVLSKPEEPPVAIDLDVDGVRLHGRLGKVYGDRRMLVRFGALRARDQLRCWIEHLALEQADAGLRSVCVGWSRKLNHHHFDRVNGPHQALKDLVDQFRFGRDAPLHFFPEASLAAARVLWKDRNKTWKAANDARKQWQDSWKMEGEFNRSPHYQLGWSEKLEFDDPAFFDRATAIFTPLLNHRDARRKK